MLYWNRICANLEETGWISAGLLTEKVNAEREENDMKKTMTMLLACAITAASLAGCSGADKTQTAAEKETVEETTAAETSAESKEETTAADTSAAEETKTAGGTLIVGFDQDFPPMGFVGDDGEYTGFDLDKSEAKRS